MKKITKNLFISMFILICIILNDDVFYAAEVACYQVSSAGNSTSYYIRNTGGFDYNCVKTYANGNKVTRKFRYYLSGEDYTTLPIPGLYNTNVLGNDCKTMVPQGICQMGEYTIVSAYDYEGKENSVLYAINSKRKLVATIVLPYKVHAGGVIFDGHSVWVCNGKRNYGRTSNVKDSTFVYYVTKKQIITAINLCEGKKSVIIKGIEKQKYDLVDFDAAYCTFYENILWFGTFNSKETGIANAYTVSYSGDVPKLKKIGDMEMPRATQGMTFYRYNNKIYLIISASYKRQNGAEFENRLIVYEPIDYDRLNNQGLSWRDYHKGNRTKDITIPNMSENIHISSSSMYLIFESGAYEYSHDINNCCPVAARLDSICKLDFKKIAID